jgi:hypothetical protein
MNEQTKKKIKQIIASTLPVLIVTLIFISAYLINVSYIIPLVLLVTAVYLKRSFREFDRLLLPLSLFIVIIIVCAKLIVIYSSNLGIIACYLVPVAAVCMLTTILFADLRLSFIIALISSVCAGKIMGNNINLAINFLIAGLTASLLVYQTRRRSQIIKASFFVGIMQAFSFLLIQSPQNILLENTLLIREMSIIFVSGIISFVVVLSTLPIFEYLFKVVTNISLLELSDFNHPLLKKMILEAPGTYQHSLVVGNLAEAAAEAIGINSLLARVGAYYHDIGKIGKSEYFSENQMFASSKHDNLQPSISRLVIINHVKEGIELAHKYKLNPVVEEFIGQHHGTSLMYYFYRRALEDAEVQEDVEVDEEGYRYPGPKPQRKEVAVVLLADSVEAASRSLAEPTPERITELVHKIINNKFIDGQLDLCELTLVDLHKIASTFIRILSAIYHSRIQYPEEIDENLYKESSKKEAGKKPTNNKAPSKENP